MVYSTFTALDELEIRRHRHDLGEERSRCHLDRPHHRSPTHLAQKRIYSESGINVLIPVNARYQTAVDYRSYRLIRKSQRYDEDVASEMQKMRKKWP